MIILIVDNHDTDRKLLQEQLGSLGHTVLEAADGVEALEQLDGTRVDVVVADIFMPNMDGYRLCFEIRNNQNYDTIPIIIYTSRYGSPGDEMLSLELGADKYLRKPSSTAEIVDALWEVTTGDRFRRLPLVQHVPGVKEYNERLVNKLEQIHFELNGRPEHPNPEIHQRDQLEESLILLSAIAQQTADSIVVTDLEGAIQFVNSSFEKITGYRREEVLGQTPRILKSGKQDGEFYERLWKTVASGGIFRDVFINKRKDGTFYHEDKTITPIRDNRGHIASYLAAGRDVTDRVLAEEALRESTERYRLLFDSNPIPMWVYDRETLSFLNVNRAAIDHYGYTREEFLSMTTKKLWLGDDDVTLRHTRRQRGCGLPELAEVRHRTRDGTIIEVEIVAHDIAYDARKARLVLAKDVTTVNQSRRALAASEADLRDLFLAMTDVVLVLDTQGRYLRVAPTNTGSLVRPPTELVGRTIYDVLPPDKADEILRYIRMAIEQHGPVHIEYNLQVNGSTCWFDGTVSPMGEGKVIWIARDTSARKKMEAELVLREQRLNAFFSGAVAGMALLDVDLRFIQANDILASWNGVPTQDHIGRRFEEIAPDLAPKLVPLFRKVLATGESIQNVDVTGEWKHAGGVERHWVGSIFPVAGINGTLGGVGTLVVDITDRKKAENALLESEERFRLIAGTIKEVYWITDINNRQMLYISPAYEHIWGRSLDSLYENPRSFLEAVHPEDLAGLLDALKTRESGQAFDYEYRILRPDASVRWIWDRGYPISEPSGAVTRYVGVAQDVTERHLAECEVERAHDQLKNIFDSLDEVVFSLDVVNDTLVQISPACEKVFGYPQEAFRKNARLWYEVIHPEDQACVRAGEAKLLEGIPGVWDYRIVRPGGEIRSIQTKVKPTINSLGQLVRIDGLSLDTTERKKIEESLELQSSYFRQLFENSPAGIALFDNSDHVLDVNPAFQKMFQFTLDDLKGNSVNHLIVPADRAQEATEMSDESRLRDVVHLETVRKRRDGSPVQVTIISYPIIVSGVCVGVYRLYIDNTEQKRLEGQFLRAQRMESIGTLAGGIAHDLNNVLAPIMMGIEIVRAKVKDNAAKRTLDIMEATARRGADMVKQVLAFGRGLEGERVDVQLRHLIGDAERILHETFPKMIQLEFSVRKDLWLVSADATQLHQVLINLLVNARDAMPGGGKLSVSAENIVIDDQYAKMHIEAKSGPYVAVTITDTGTGIAANLIDKIFDPFFTTKEIGKGTGLGLSTALGIIRSHGGFINVYSEVGRGTKFVVYLPVAITHSVHDVSGDKQPKSPGGNGELVLVVDDEEPVREMIYGTLTNNAYKVLTAEDGTDALTVYITQMGKIDLVVLDMMMPFMDGVSTIRALRKLNPTLPIVATSGLPQNASLPEIGGDKNLVFLQKPYAAEKLLRVVHEALARRGVGVTTSAVET